MMDDMFRMIELKQQGFYCSQILILYGLAEQGKENPDLVRCMHGLAGGLGFSGEVCGALTGGACLLGLYAGKGLPEEQENPLLMFMIEDLVKWFKETTINAYGGIRCAEILGDDEQNMAKRCPSIVIETYQKVNELLKANDFLPSEH